MPSSCRASRSESSTCGDCWRRLSVGREQKIILIEVANEAWQNGFPGERGVADLREFTKYLAERTEVPIATTSNHEDEFGKVYANSAADIATWHFSRDRRTDDGWKPVYDCWDIGDRPGFPPVSSNEPIGPGSSVATETSSIRLVMAAAFAYAAKLPMYVFHSQAGVFGKTRFEDTPAIGQFHPFEEPLPPNCQTGGATMAGRKKRLSRCSRTDSQTGIGSKCPRAATDACAISAAERVIVSFASPSASAKTDGLQLKPAKISSSKHSILSWQESSSRNDEDRQKVVLPAFGRTDSKGRVRPSTSRISEFGRWFLG